MVLFMLMSMGCIDSTLTPKHGGSGIDLLPKLVVTPNRLTYGEAGWGEMRQMDFAISNEGDEGSVLYVDRIFIDGAPGFRMVDDFHEFSLVQGEPPVPFTVSFSPLAPELHEGELIIESDDGSGEVEESQVGLVFLDGSGIMPELQITPDPYNFGSVNLTCDRVGQIDVKNVGTDVARIDEFTLSNPAWTIDDGVTFPFELSPGAERSIDLRFTPSDVASYESTLTVRSNEPIGARTASQLGAGINPGSHEERFEMPPEPPVDIGIYVDPSCSMKDDQEALAANFPSFIAAFEEITLDWQAILINTDDGCSLTGVITPETPNYEQVFADATSLTRAGVEAYEESGFTVLERALDEAGPAGCNPNFLRNDAYLHAIFISDEPEQSAAVSGNPARTWDYFVNEFTRMKGDQSLLRMSTVSGEYPSGCDSDTNHAEAGVGYIEAADATGGAQISICTRWAENIDLIVDATFERGQIVLTEGNPDPETIEVEVDGDDVTEWVYDAATRTITFEEGHEPGARAQIVVTYDDMRFCD